MTLHFVDINPAVAGALRDAFKGFSGVHVSCANILTVARHCLVSPANSFGYMDGGIDAAYLEFFGPSIQTRVQGAIQRRPEGYLPVGASLWVETGHAHIPYLIVAPTMEVPEEVPASHAGRALRAVLRLVDVSPHLGTEVYCPGLATHTGRAPVIDAAQSMREYYGDWLQTRQSQISARPVRPSDDSATSFAQGSH